MPTKRTKIPEKNPIVKQTRKKSSVKKKTRKVWPLALKLVLAGITLVLLSPFYYGYVLKTGTSTWQWIKDIGQDSNYPNYYDFDIRIPKKYSIHGIDVSYAQGKIDWQKVKSMKEGDVSITFAFIKATEGLLTVDPYFKRNWREAPKAGIVCGAYHYFRPKKSGKQQARFFLQTVNVENGDLPVVVDVETLDGKDPATMRKELHDFIVHIEAKTHVKPIIYSGLSFYQDYLQGYFDDHILWIAHYYKKELKTRNTNNWQFWQHSDIAKVNGINHAVDFNAFKGDLAAFQKLIIKSDDLNR
ncbi:Lysozyme M1 precursor [Arcticibacter svalbardensis MN12-7]|uniref:Lysozyme M1 n=1 Tax=Arcticibacter svalbardensis MN12-7 TaxID=1150600 RepID=R9GNP9_9SPHI|nr:GH25 family lysozyme [Arcticibacter svalbardensis]EOR93331.1 Lysozyme M1 precursor [Arcticibacter svalbardensis MN12-7]